MKSITVTILLFAFIILDILSTNLSAGPVPRRNIFSGSLVANGTNSSLLANLTNGNVTGNSTTGILSEDVTVTNFILNATVDPDSFAGITNKAKIVALSLQPVKKKHPQVQDSVGNPLPFDQHGIYYGMAKDAGNLKEKIGRQELELIEKNRADERKVNATMQMSYGVDLDEMNKAHGLKGRVPHNVRHLSIWDNRKPKDPERYIDDEVQQKKVLLVHWGYGQYPIKTLPARALELSSLPVMNVTTTEAVTTTTNSVEAVSHFLAGVFGPLEKAFSADPRFHSTTVHSFQNYTVKKNVTEPYRGYGPDVRQQVEEEEEEEEYDSPY